MAMLSKSQIMISLKTTLGNWLIYTNGSVELECLTISTFVILENLKENEKI